MKIVRVSIVGVGITADGRKQALDFELGSSENLEVCRDLVSRLVVTGFVARNGHLAVLDGSDALKNAVLSTFSHAMFPRCVFHKEPSIRRRLLKRH